MSHLSGTSYPNPSQHTAKLRLGIGLITYNRRLVLSRTLTQLTRHTKHSNTVVAVADDGSTDGTLEMLSTRQILTVTGRNMGVAWNKNRALFLLFELARCDIVILIEDDVYPERDYWEADWLQVAISGGHANSAVPWLRDYNVSGAGTGRDPILGTRLSAQCAVFSREAILFGGYLDTRFRGYGYEHTEHTCRLLRMGYGGKVDISSGVPFHLLWGGIGYHPAPSTRPRNQEQIEINKALAQALCWDFSYRPPWRDFDEAQQLRYEMRHTAPYTFL